MIELLKEIVEIFRPIWSQSPEGRACLAKCDAAIAAEEKRERKSLTKKYADILEVQEREAFNGDSYMLGLYNGMLLICSAEDNVPYVPMNGQRVNSDIPAGPPPVLDSASVGAASDSRPPLADVDATPARDATQSG